MFFYFFSSPFIMMNFCTFLVYEYMSDITSKVVIELQHLCHSRVSLPRTRRLNLNLPAGVLSRNVIRS